MNGSVDDTRFKDIVGGVLTPFRARPVTTSRPIAVFGELVALLWAAGKPLEAIRVEQLWNDLAKVHSFSLLCAYPVTGLTIRAH